MDDVTVFMKFPGRGVSVRDNEIEFDIRKAEAEVNGVTLLLSKLLRW